jgi:hypothetical protein
MPLPKLKMPTLTTPGRRVVVLPDEWFFVRNVPLAAGPEAQDVQSQVELALETIAPFPLTQLYYGYWTKPGLDRALVFAAYRKRFSAEEADEWVGADFVAPRFALLLGATGPEPATTWVLQSAEGLTLVHFGDGSGVPTLVRHEPLPADADAKTRVVLRDNLLRAVGGTRQLFEIDDVEVEAGEPGEGGFRTKGGLVQSELSVNDAEALDVRDKAELAARRRARVRDRWLWRGVLLGVTIIALCAVAELALVGLQFWQRARVEQIARQTPVVNQIETAQSLANRIEELQTRRLRPFEMIEAVTAVMPDQIQFLSTTTSGLYTLEVQAQTTAQTQIDQYQRALQGLATVESAVIEVQRTQANVTTFRMAVTFRPNAFTAPADGGSS